MNRTEKLNINLDAPHRVDFKPPTPNQYVAFKDRIYRDKALRNLRGFVAFKLLELARKRGYTYASSTTLAAIFEIDRQTLGRAIKYLVEKGYFVRVNVGGGRKASEYAPVLQLEKAVPETATEYKGSSRFRRNQAAKRSAIIDNATG